MSSNPLSKMPLHYKLFLGAMSCLGFVLANGGGFKEQKDELINPESSVTTPRMLVMDTISSVDVSDEKKAHYLEMIETALEKIPTPLPADKKERVLAEFKNAHIVVLRNEQSDARIESLIDRDQPGRIIANISNEIIRPAQMNTMAVFLVEQIRIYDIDLLIQSRSMINRPEKITVATSNNISYTY